MSHHSDVYYNLMRDRSFTESDLMTDAKYREPQVYFGQYPIPPYMMGPAGFPHYHATDVLTKYSADELYEWSGDRIAKKIDVNCMVMSSSVQKIQCPSNYYFLTKKFEHLYAFFHCKTREEFLTNLKEKTGKFDKEFVWNFLEDLFTNEFYRTSLVPSKYWVFSDDELEFVFDLVRIYTDCVNSHIFANDLYDVSVNIISYSESKHHPYGKQISDVMVKSLSDKSLKLCADDTLHPIFLDEIKLRST